MVRDIEGGRPHFERTPQQSKPTEQHKANLEAGNGAPGLPPTLHERAHPPPENEAGTPLAAARARQIHDVGYAEGQERRARELDEKWVKKMQARGEVIPHSPEEIREKRLEARRRYLNTNREKVNESSRRRRKERTEQGLFPPSKQKPKQVFPEPTHE